MDEFVTCAASFEKLQGLMKLWEHDIKFNNSVYADDFMSHFYRWLTNSTSSKLYDPLLHRLVHKMMLKHLQKLVFELKQLDCKVVYSSLNRMILETKKRTYADAEAHINYVIK